MEHVEDLLQTVEYFGFLPFFRCGIPGFSVEDMTPPELWFTEQDGPWEWKGPAAASGRCMYGKLFHGCAGFVSTAWLPDFCNWRRDGYDFESFYEDGKVSRNDRELIDTLADGPMLSRELKRTCGYRKDGKKGFDTAVTRLQMQTFLCISDFEYARDRNGREYGWGIARYALPESLFGEDLINAADSRTPEASLERMHAQLVTRLPDADPGALMKLLARK